MLELTKKKYKVEEIIKATNDENEVIYEFSMQLTPEEYREINKIITSEEMLKIQKDKKLNEEEIDEKIIELAYKNQDRFEKLCYKEHLEPFKKAVGEQYFEDMNEQLFDFFWEAFIGKKAKRANTMTSDLRKISGN